MKFWSLTMLEFVILTKFVAASDENFMKMTTFLLQWCMQLVTGMSLPISPHVIPHENLSIFTLQWCRNGHDSVSNHQPHDCLINHLFRHWSKKTSKLHDTGLCVGNSLMTGEFPAQMASNAENGSNWWRHYDLCDRSWYLGQVWKMKS